MYKGRTYEILLSGVEIPGRIMTSTVEQVCRREASENYKAPRFSMIFWKTSRNRNDTVEHFL